MSLFAGLVDNHHESLHVFCEPVSGLRALVGVHSTKLGPSLGGTRALSSYVSDEAAVTDVLRLSRGMTYKAALAGLKHGGGKAVIMLPPTPLDQSQRKKLFEAFGVAVESLGGRYITTEDSGTSPADMAAVRAKTRHVCGMDDTSGDPSPVTAYGVVRGLEAAAKHVLGSSDLANRTVTVMGVGHVGMALVKELRDRGAQVFVCDLNRPRLEDAVSHLGAVALSEAELLEKEVDIFAPCALGSAINDATLPKLKVKIVGGAANNQLAEPRHGELLASRGIIYLPDYAINAGGLINVAQEILGYDRKVALERAGGIYDTIEALLRRAKETGNRPEEIADRMVEEKLKAA